MEREARRRLCLGRRVEPCDYTWDMRNMNHSHVCHFLFLTRRMRMCHMTHSCVTWRIHSLTHYFGHWYSYVWHDSFHMCDMTHSYVWHKLMYILIFMKSQYLMQYMTHSIMCHDSVTCVTWLIHVWHHSFIYVTWLIHILTQMSSRFTKYSGVDTDNTGNIVFYPVLRLCVTALQRCLLLSLSPSGGFPVLSPPWRWRSRQQETALQCCHTESQYRM